MKLINTIGIGAMMFAAVACSTNPITGRRSLQLANDAEIASMAAQEYQKTLTQSKIISGTTQAKSVANVGTRIKNAAYNYYKTLGREGDLTNYQWEFKLIDNKQINAWCMRSEEHTSELQSRENL